MGERHVLIPQGLELRLAHRRKIFPLCDLPLQPVIVCLQL